jgi:hypothetical protein
MADMSLGFSADITDLVDTQEMPQAIASAGLAASVIIKNIAMMRICFI